MTDRPTPAEIMAESARTGNIINPLTALAAKRGDLVPTILEVFRLERRVTGDPAFATASS